MSSDDDLGRRMRRAAATAVLPLTGPEDARSRADSRTRQRATASAVVASLAAVTVVTAVLTREEGNDTLRIGPAVGASSAPAPTAGFNPSPSTSPGPRVQPSPSVAPAPPATAAASPSPSRRLWLNGADLGVTRVGAPYQQAVAAISAVLGPPLYDPDPVTHCVDAQREVGWANFHLAVTDGKVSGWASTDGRIATPSGVRVGTTVARLKQVYGERLRLLPPQVDSGRLFDVTGVDQFGSLTDGTDSGTVLAFANGACTGP